MERKNSGDKKMMLSILFALVIFAGVLISQRFGVYLGHRNKRVAGEEGMAGVGSLEGATFGLMGLLVAFTFTGAATRFYERRDLITQQVNAIGTAWLRLDLLKEPERKTLQEGFRRYVDIELEIVREGGDEEQIRAGMNRLSAVQQEIWTNLVQAVRNDTSLPLAQVVLPPVNEMFDLSTSRLMAAQQHPPLPVFLMLGLLVLLSSLFAGFDMARARTKSPLHVYGFAVVMALSVYLILDIEYPRLGFITIESFDRAMIDLRATMG